MVDMCQISMNSIEWLSSEPHKMSLPCCMVALDKFTKVNRIPPPGPWIGLEIFQSGPKGTDCPTHRLCRRHGSEKLDFLFLQPLKKRKFRCRDRSRHGILEPISDHSVTCGRPVVTTVWWVAQIFLDISLIAITTRRLLSQSTSWESGVSILAAITVLRTL